MTALKDHFRRHMLAYLLTLVATVVHALPYIRDLGTAESPFLQGDELCYAAMFQRFADGAGDPWLAEHASDPFPFPELPFSATGAVARTIGITTFFILTDFLLTPLIFILAYLIALEILEGKKFESCLMAISFCLLYGFFAHFCTNSRSAGVLGGFSSLLAFRTAYANLGWELGRIPFPALSTPFYMACVLLLLRAAKGSSKCAAGLCALLTFLSYFRFYDWAFCMCVCACICIWLIYKKEFQFAKMTAVACAVSLLLAFPGIVGSMRRMEMFPVQFERFGLEQTRSVFTEDIFSGTFMFVVFLPLTAFVVRGHPWFKLLAASAVISYIVCTRMNVVTGRSPSVIHWEVYNIGPLAVAFLIVTAVIIIKSELLRAKICLVVIGAIVLFAAQRNYYAAPQISQNVMNEKKELIAVCSELQRRPDGVVLGPLGFTEYYSGKRNFLPAMGLFTMATDDEILMRLLLAYRLFGVNEGKIVEILRNIRQDDVFTQAVYASQKRAEGISAASSKWAEYYKGLPSTTGELIRVIRLRYRLDYIIAFSDNGVDNLKNAPELELICSTSRVFLFRVKQ